MHSSDQSEIESVLSFFRQHSGRELDIALSMFDGLIQRERMRVVEAGQAGAPHYRVRLLSPDSQRELEIDLDHYSFASVSPDQKEVEITRLLGGNRTFRLIASEIRS